jgi:hypothetical protein
VLQVVGKYLYLPYWKLIPGMQPDPVVLDKIRQDFRGLSQNDKIGEIQTCLYLKGYNVPVSGQLDSRTQAALASFKPDYNPAQGGNDAELYVALWSSLSDNMDQISNRRELLAKALNSSSPAERVAAVPAKTGGKAAATKVAKQKPVSAPAQKPAEKSGSGPSAVARTNPDKHNQEESAKNGQSDLAQLGRTFPLSGSKNSAEAMLNERNMAQ